MPSNCSPSTKRVMQNRCNCNRNCSSANQTCDNWQRQRWIQKNDCVQSIYRLLGFHSFMHVTIKRKGIKLRKFLVVVRCNSLCRCLIFENAKIFRSYVKHFSIFPHERNCRILTGLCKYVFMKPPIMFLD